ncbi:MAG: selenide, water dikinase SelD, partial [Alphaproteobacteria bacterium]
QTPLIEKELVLVGGGHAHVAVLRAFAMNPISGVRVTLICRDVHTPYSGMLPGFLAGHYSYDDVHIDLSKLCQFADVRFINDEVLGINPEGKTLSFGGDRPDMGFDVLSINTGSAPKVQSVPGALKYSVPVKPISQFLERWSKLLKRLENGSKKVSIVVVGGGAGGVELCLAIQHRLRSETDYAHRVNFTLVSRSKTVLPTHPAKAQQIFHEALTNRGVKLALGQAVTEVFSDHVSLADGTTELYDELLWVTKAGAPDWLHKTGLTLTDAGFLKVRNTLQVEGFNDIFAVGDVADVTDHPREKAGVFAVRQGKPAARNIRRRLLGKTVKAFTPQTKWLSLISTGDKFAVGTRGDKVISGKFMWQWKDGIDRKFMNLYGELEPFSMGNSQSTISEQNTQIMRCLGCGAKVGGGVLEAAISQVSSAVPDVFEGIGDDASLIETDGQPIWQSLDYLPAFSQDPFLFTQVAVEHALSDLYAMGVKPHSVQLLVSQPASKPNLGYRDLTAILTAVALKLKAINVKLIGGHTVEGDFGIGLVVNGKGHAKFYKGGLKAGDSLILTKPLGSGVILAGHMALKAKGRWVSDAFDNMLVSNSKASERALEFNASAVTDVTGFGLAGHALEMAKASNLNIELDSGSVPVLTGALELSTEGQTSSLYAANSTGFLESGEIIHPKTKLLFDPQTSGGLLIGISNDNCKDLLNGLIEDGYSAAKVVGKVKERAADQTDATLRFQ